MKSTWQLSTHHRDYLAGGNEICLHIHKRGQANPREEERERRKSLNISVTFSRFSVKAWRYIVCEGRQVYDIVC